MLQLTLNNLPAVIKSGTSIKLTRENQLLTDAGDYTLDVTLPLNGCAQNQQIFGPVHRPEISRMKSLERGNYNLQADNIHIQGKFVITSLTQDEVKIQLLGGRSSFNLMMTDDDGNDIYIDELDLGTAYSNIFHGWYGWDLKQTLLRTMDMFFLHPESAGNLTANSDITDCVCFPIYSSQDGAYSNQRCLNEWWHTSNSKTSFESGSMTGFDTDSPTYSLESWPLYEESQSAPGVNGAIYSFYEKNVMAPQPYLCFIIEEVLKAIGYEVSRDNDEIRKTWMKNIFIANARGTLKFNQMLPHWTVKDFIKEVQHFLGIAFKIDNNQVSIIRRNTTTSNTTHYLEKVVDEFTADISKDVEEKDMTKANIGYAFDSIDNQLKLPDEVWENANLVSVEDNYALSDYESITPTADVKASRDLITVKSDGYRHAWISYTDQLGDEKWQLQRVDQMGNLLQHSGRDLDIELKIVPISMEDRDDALLKKAFVRFQNETTFYFEKSGNMTFSFPVLKTGDTRVVTGYEDYSVNAAIKNTSTKQDTNKRDVLEVAVNDINISQDGTETVKNTWSNEFTDPFLSAKRTLSDKVAVGIPYLEKLGDYWQPFGSYFILNFAGSGENNIKNDTISNVGAAVETRVETEISFIDVGNFLPSDIYIIKGRKYVCEKLEFTIDENGVNKLKRGYFFEVN